MSCRDARRRRHHRVREQPWCDGTVATWRWSTLMATLDAQPSVAAGIGDPQAPIGLTDGILRARYRNCLADAIGSGCCMAPGTSPARPSDHPSLRSRPSRARRPRRLPWALCGAVPFRSRTGGPPRDLDEQGVSYRLGVDPRGRSDTTSISGSPTRSHSAWRPVDDPVTCVRVGQACRTRLARQ